MNCGNASSNDGGSLTKRQYENYVALRFLRHLAGAWTVLSQPEPPQADVIAGDGDLRIGIEFCRYREQGPHNEQQVLSAKFEKYVCDQWLYDPSVNECSLSLDWKQDEHGRFQLPNPSEWASVVNKLKLLAVKYRPPSEHVRHKIALVVGKPPDPRPRRLSPTLLLFESCEFEGLFNYFKGVRLDVHPGLFLGLPRSSMHTRVVRLDRTEIQRKTQEKTGRLVSYRRENDLPLWLIFHSDGSPSTSILPGPMVLDQACAEVMKAAPSNREQWFDAVWWFDLVMAEHLGEVRLIHPSSPPVHFASILPAT